jgi:hypothetical protein
MFYVLPLKFVVRGGMDAAPTPVVLLARVVGAVKVSV